MKSRNVPASILGLMSAAWAAALFAFPAAIHLPPEKESGYVIYGPAGVLQLGRAVANAGDMNGDGRADFAITSVPPIGSSTRGKTFVVFSAPALSDKGSIDLTRIDGSNGTIITAPSSYYLGSSIASADFDGDGLDDLILGAQNYGPSPFEKGAVFVVFGSDRGFPAVIDLDALRPSQGFLIAADPALTFANVGASVASAGDFNGDGFDDVLIGAPTASAYGSSEGGVAYLVYGRSARPRSGLSLSDLQSNQIVRFNGSLTYRGTGGVVAGVGDINDDGKSDIALSCPQSNGVDGCVVFGAASIAAETDVAAISGSVGFKIAVGSSGAVSIPAFAATGDLNGDGISDFALGTNSRAGAIAYAVFGRDEGFGDSITLSDLNGSSGRAIVDTTNSPNGAYVKSLSGLGDHDGDARPDLLIGTSNADNNLFGQFAYIVSARTALTEFLTPLTSLEGSRGTWMCSVGSNSDGLVGASLGDVNGDSLDDLAIGDRSIFVDGVERGAAYVVFGSDRIFSGGFEVHETRQEICDFL